MQIEAIYQPASQQQIFRALMEAMARPGTVQDIRHSLDSAPAWRGVLASLLDTKTSFADCHNLLEDRDWPLFQAVQAAAEQADYLLCLGNAVADISPRVGTLSCPDQAATIVLNVESLGTGNTEIRLKGPGIRDVLSLQIDGLEKSWLTFRAENISFPLGIDLILVDHHQLAAIPRTTSLEVMS